ncbi:cupin-like domain-containing protein [Mucilaginibacter sp.]|uniref:cupin-like domain-containing protein n=1 Tax=Mucilaginibacter sp. TaxID=1882438 RepID=UPI003D0F0C1E
MVTEQFKPLTNYSEVKGVDKRTNLSQDEFINEYVKHSRPVVLTDAAKEWKAMKKLTPQYFKDNYAHITKTINGVTYKMDDFIDQMLASTAANPAPYPYNFNVEKVFPELMADFLPEIIYGKIDRINHKLMPKQLLQGTTVYEIFLGGNGSSFPYLHYDALFMHTQITQVYGSKVFIMYPPEQTPSMYPFPDNPKFSQVNFLDPDYEKFPLFKEAKPIEFTLLEGETLLFPSGWWHTTKITEPCISLGRAQLNGNNWDNFINDRYVNWKKKISYAAAPVLIYGKIVGGIMNAQER